MANSMIGLRVKPTYEDLIGVAVSDKLYNIKFPNRDATFLRNGFVLSQLDGEGARTMEKQQEMASKEAYKEHLLKEIAKNTGSNIHDLRNDSHQEMRTERTTNAVYFDMSHSDDMDVSRTNEAGVQSQANTNESGAQTQTQTNESGAQTMRPRLTKSTGAQAEPRVNTKETQATEDKSEEIAKIQRASELEKEALIEQHKNNIERVIQQARVESELAHEGKRQVYHLEAMEKIHITETEAQRKIHQIQQSAQQEAQSYVGNLINFAENKYRDVLRSKDQAEKEAIEAKKSEHNALYRAIPSTPERNPRAKAKNQPSPKTVPPFPTGERATGSQERPRYNVHPNDNVNNPESTHEPKGPTGRPSNTQPKPKAKSRARGPNIRVDAKTRQEPPPPNNNPAHDTEKDENKKPSYWNKQLLGYMRDQLTKRGFRTTHKPNGKALRRPDYLEEVLRLIAAGRW